MDVSQHKVRKKHTPNIYCMHICLSQFSNPFARSKSPLWGWGWGVDCQLEGRGREFVPQCPVVIRGLADRREAAPGWCAPFGDWLCSP